MSNRPKAVPVRSLVGWLVCSSFKGYSKVSTYFGPSSILRDTCKKAGKTDGYCSTYLGETL
jgi:hypothetical protein